MCVQDDDLSSVSSPVSSGAFREARESLRATVLSQPKVRVSRWDVPPAEEALPPMAPPPARAKGGFSLDAAGGRGRPRKAVQTDHSVGQGQVNAFFGVAGSSVPSSYMNPLSSKNQ